MDHIPKPNRLAYRIPTVPYLCKYAYDGQGFKTYPSRRGFDITQLRSGEVSNLSKDELAAFLQSWLYFGLLSEFFEQDFHERDFLRRQESIFGEAFIVRTVSLPELSEKWAARWRAATMETTRSRCARLASSLDEAAHVARWACTGSGSIIPPTVSLSILLLGDALSYMQSRVLDSIYGTTDHGVITRYGRLGDATNLMLGFQDLDIDSLAREPPEQADVHGFFDVRSLENTLPAIAEASNSATRSGKPMFEDDEIIRIDIEDVDLPSRNETRGRGQFGQSHYVRQKMLSAGWCPRAISVLEKSMSVSGVFYASLVPREHTDNHALCTQDKCCSDYMDETLYQPKHVPEYQTLYPAACECGGIMSDVPEKELIDVLECGGIPLIQLMTDPINPGITCMVRSSADWPDYIAVSHVWSDGLGNPNGNNIFQCQIWQLYDVVHKLWRDLPERVYASQSEINKFCEADILKPATFWLDTMCIPKDPHWRAVAISRMAKLYESARRVLLIDAELKRTPVDYVIGDPGSREVLSLLMRLRVSRWMQRAWTLQEGLLAENIVVLLKNGKTLTVDGYALALELERDIDRPDFSCMIYAEAAKPFIQMRQMRGMRGLPAPPSWVWRLIRLALGRTTTRPDDEALILASMTITDPERFAEAPVRMSAKMRDVAGQNTVERTTYRQIVANERMRAYFGSQRLWPRYLVFLSGERIDEDGFRWAPKSLLTTDSFADDVSHRNESENMGKLDPDGLKVFFPGLELRSPQHHPKPPYIIRDEVDGYNYLVEDSPGNRRSTRSSATLDGDYSGLHFALVLLNKSLRSTQTQPAVLVSCQDLPEEDDMHAPWIRTLHLETLHEPNGQRRQRMRIPKTFQERRRDQFRRKTIKCRYEVRLHVRRLSETLDPSLCEAIEARRISSQPAGSPKRGDSLHGGVSYQIVDGRMLSPYQQWCIG